MALLFSFRLNEKLKYPCIFFLAGGGSVISALSVEGRRNPNKRIEMVAGGKVKYSFTSGYCWWKHVGDTYWIFLASRNHFRNTKA